MSFFLGFPQRQLNAVCQVHAYGSNVFRWIHGPRNLCRIPLFTVAILAVVLRRRSGGGSEHDERAYG